MQVSSRMDRIYPDYPNDEKQILITFVGLAVAAVTSVWLIMMSVVGS